jgi:hypothetical protein
MWGCGLRPHVHLLHLAGDFFSALMIFENLNFVFELLRNFPQDAKIDYM